MAAKIQSKAQLDAAFKDGWTLAPRRMDSGYILQKGLPGHGGEAKTVTYRAVQAFLKQHSVRKVGSMFDWYYVRQDKV